MKLVEDSLSLRTFLGVPLTKKTPDHSSFTRIADRLPERVYQQVFTYVLDANMYKETGTVLVNLSSGRPNGASTRFPPGRVGARRAVVHACPSSGDAETGRRSEAIVRPTDTVSGPSWTLCDSTADRAANASG
jgi:hypothetical protein